MFRRLLVCVSPADEIAVLPRTRGELQSKRHPARMKDAGNHHRRYSDGIHPTCAAVRTAARTSVRLRNGFIVRWHLKRGIDITVESKTIQGLFVGLKRFSLRSE